jgi:hypothetical protein
VVEFTRGLCWESVWIVGQVCMQFEIGDELVGGGIWEFMYYVKLILHSLKT